MLRARVVMPASAWSRYSIPIKHISAALDEFQKKIVGNSDTVFGELDGSGSPMTDIMNIAFSVDEFAHDGLSYIMDITIIDTPKGAVMQQFAPVYRARFMPKGTTDEDKMEITSFSCEFTLSDDGPDSIKLILLPTEACSVPDIEVRSDEICCPWILMSDRRPDDGCMCVVVDVDADKGQYLGLLRYSSGDHAFIGWDPYDDCPSYLAETDVRAWHPVPPFIFQ